jgi:hypothetical protein
MTQATEYPQAEGQLEDCYRVTRDGIIERLTDPYLTEHDRWVLHQFARFLAGQVPDPDPRVTPRRPAPRLLTRVRRSTL